MHVKEKQPVSQSILQTFIVTLYNWYFRDLLLFAATSENVWLHFLNIETWFVWLIWPKESVRSSNLLCVENVFFRFFFLATWGQQKTQHWYDSMTVAIIWSSVSGYLMSLSLIFTLSALFLSPVIEKNVDLKRHYWLVTLGAFLFTCIFSGSLLLGYYRLQKFPIKESECKLNVSVL